MIVDATSIDPVIVIAFTCLLGLTVVMAALLRAWQGWLELKRRELEERKAAAASGEDDRHMSAGAARIELADLKERIKKLEAIASGVEL